MNMPTRPYAFIDPRRGLWPVRHCADGTKALETLTLARSPRALPVQPVTERVQLVVVCFESTTFACQHCLTVRRRAHVQLPGKSKPTRGFIALQRVSRFDPEKQRFPVKPRIQKVQAGWELAR